MVEGELARLDGDLEVARAKFAEAIECAGEGGFSNDIALAHELLAGCESDGTSSLKTARCAFKRSAKHA